MHGFKKGITPDEIRAINNSFGGSIELNGSIETILDNTSRYDGFWNKLGAITSSIVKNYTFDYGNKRTAMQVIQTLVEGNGISTGVNEATMRDVIYKIAIGELKEVEEIAEALRGF